MKLEVIATNIDDVRAAAAYGAHRIELVTGIAEGGLTPSLGLIEQAVRVSAIPVQVMVRPHSQSFRYGRGDVAVMRRDIAAIRDCGAAGIVTGALTADGQVDTAVLEDPLAALSHTHREIFRLGHQLERMGADLEDPPSAEALADIQRLLVQLDTVLDLHFADEDELYHHLDRR